MGSQVRTFFNSFTKHELTNILEYFEQPFVRNLKKAELVEQVSDYLEFNPGEWLYRLPERDLKLLRETRNAGMGQWTELDSPDFPSFVELLGIVIVDDSDPDNIKVKMVESLFEVVSSSLDRIIVEKEMDGSFDIDRFVLGIINTYGAIPGKEFIDLVFKYFGKGEKGEKMAMKIVDSQMVEVHRIFYKDNVWLVSPFVEDYEALINKRKEFKGLRKYASRKLEDIIDTGRHSPHCFYGRKSDEGLAVQDMLRALGYSEDDIIKEMCILWESAQHTLEDDVTDYLFRCVNDRIDAIDTFEEYKRCIEIVADYANSVPKWLLKGSTSYEANLLKLSIKVDEGLEEFFESFEADKVPTPMEMETPRPSWMTDFFKYGMAVKHVAPNDPCPCGSGLSYKHCHGRHLN